MLQKIKYSNLRAITILAFGISFIFTARLMLSDAIGIHNKLIMLGMTLVLETSKGYFAYYSLSKKSTLNALLKLCLGVLSIFLFAVSVMASWSYTVNQSNSTLNNHFDGANKAIEDKITMYKSQVEKLPDNWYHRREIITDKIVELESQKIKKYTNGYMGLFEMMTTDKQNLSEDKTLTADKLNLFFYSILAIAFEISTIFLLIIHQSKTTQEPVAQVKKTTKPDKTKPSEPLKKTKATEPPKVVEPLKIEPLEPLKKPVSHPKREPQKLLESKRSATVLIHQKEIDNYKKCATESAQDDPDKSGKIWGYKKIAKQIGVSQNKALKIKNNLEMQGFLKSENQSTYLAS